MFARFIDKKKLGGVVFSIWKEREIISGESQGYMNCDTKEAMTSNTIFRIASMTKPITSVLAMMLYEERKLDLNDPITKWFPQFQNMKVVNQSGTYEDAKRLITILDLLTHRAGFTYSGFQTGKLKEDYDLLLGADIDSTRSIFEWVNGLANLPLMNHPGELFNYGKSTDLLGILISEIEEKPLSKVMEEKLFRPLGMYDTFFDVPANKKDRCASAMGFDTLGNIINLETVPLQMALKERPLGLEFESGGSGLWSTVGDYLKFAKIFVENGMSGEIRILKKETIDLMCTNQLTAFQRANSTLMGSPIFSEDYGFGLGLAVVMSDNNTGSMPCAGSRGSVGWPGAYGGWWSADPVKKSISIFLTHSMAAPEQLALGIGFELYEAIDLFSTYGKANT